MKPRALVLGFAAIVVVMGAATAVWLGAMHRGATVHYCEVNARAVDVDQRGFDVPPDILERHPALLEAMSRASADGYGTARLRSCGERDAIIQDLDAAGAPSAAGTAVYSLRHDERSYEVEIAKTVA